MVDWVREVQMNTNYVTWRMTGKRGNFSARRQSLKFERFYEVAILKAFGVQYEEIPICIDRKTKGEESRPTEVE